MRIEYCPVNNCGGRLLSNTTEENTYKHYGLNWNGFNLELTDQPMDEKNLSTDTTDREFYCDAGHTEGQIENALDGN